MARLNLNDRKVYPGVVKVDMWYGDKITDVDEIDVYFYPNGSLYRGNCYIDGRIVGDYSTKDRCALEKRFPKIRLNWGEKAQN